MIKYAIFDLDGTLFDSMWIWENIDVEFLAKFGYTPTKELREKIKTLSIRQSSEFLKTSFNLPQSVEEIITEIGDIAKDKYKNEVQFKPFALEYLKKLKANGAKLCIVTASMRENVLSSLTRFGAIDIFDFIITGDDMKTGKDTPEIFLKCAKRFQALPRDIVVFEDALYAITTAKNAGFKVIGVYDNTAKEDTIKIKNICDQYIKNFSEMEDLS